MSKSGTVLAAVLAGAWSCSAPSPQIEPPQPVDEHVAPVVVAEEGEPLSPRSPRDVTSAAPLSAKQGAPGGKAAGFKIPPGFEPALMAGAGDELFFVHRSFRDGGKVGRLKRSGEQLVHRGPNSAEHIRINGRGASLDVIVVGRHGGLARYRNGAWEYRLAPALEGEAIGASAVASDGTVYAAGTHHALYLWKGDSWTIKPYGSTGTAVMEALVASDGTLYLIGRHGRILSYDGKGFRDVAIKGLTASHLASKWEASWADVKRMTLWVVAAKMLLSIDLNSKQATSFGSALFFDLESITGCDTPTGPLLMVGTFGRTALFDGKNFYEADDSGADTLFIDRPKAQGYAASHGRMRVIDLKHPALGNGPGKIVKR
jgi:hypothetical protein